MYADTNEMLANYITNVDRANIYYGNYIKTKTWNEENLRKVEERDKAIAALKEQNETYLNNYQQAKAWNEESLRKVEDRDKTIAVLKEQNETYLNNYNSEKKRTQALRTQLLDDNYELKKMKNDFINFEINNANRINRLMNDNKLNVDALNASNKELTKKANELSKKNSNLEQNSKKLQQEIKLIKKREVPEAFQYMAASRVGNILARIFMIYHRIRTK